MVVFSSSFLLRRSTETRKSFLGTGLMDTSDELDGVTWEKVQSQCIRVSVGGRKVWQGGQTWGQTGDSSCYENDREKNKRTSQTEMPPMW